MARYRYGRNPDLFGQDMTSLAIEGFGVGLTGVLTDKLTKPLLGNFVPSALSSGAAAKAMDAVLTGITAWGVGLLGGMVNRGVANKLRRGGALLTVAKGVSIVVPNYSLVGSIPTFNFFPPPPPPPAAALPAAGNGTATRRLLGVNSMGL